MRVRTHEFLVETNGVHLHVGMVGDPAGKPVVLLHGFPEFRYGWRHQIPSLVGTGYRQSVTDRRGSTLLEET